MLTGFEKVVEERIRRAQQKGEFENLPGHGKPLALDEGVCVPEELRLAYKILKNADCLPPELEVKKEIRQTEDLLAGMRDTAARYRILKKLNFLIMKLNTLRSGTVTLCPSINRQFQNVKEVNRTHFDRHIWSESISNSR